MSNESNRIKRRRSMIYRREKALVEAQSARDALPSLGRNDPFTRGIYDGRVSAAERKVLDSWDALRRAQTRAKRSGISGPVLFDPLALTSTRHYLHDPTRGDALRSHSHGHSKPSHHVGPCDWSCRMGGRSHEHRSGSMRRRL